MPRDQFSFLGRPVLAGKGGMHNTDDKTTLFGHDIFAVDEAERKYSVGNCLTDIFDLKASFLEQLTPGSLCEALFRIDGSSRRRPIILTGERAFRERRPEQ
jgi:hypothetical protein